MHLKADLIDGSVLRTGSANWSPPREGAFCRRGYRSHHAQQDNNLFLAMDRKEIGAPFPSGRNPGGGDPLPSRKGPSRPATGPRRFDLRVASKHEVDLIAVFPEANHEDLSVRRQSDIEPRTAGDGKDLDERIGQFPFQEFSGRWSAPKFGGKDGFGSLFEPPAIAQGVIF